MKELYAEYRKKNRFRFGWLLLFLCALIWVIEGGYWLIAAAAAVFFGTIERARAYTYVPMPKACTRESGLMDLCEWRRQMKGNASFGETLRDKQFSVWEYFWRIYIGMVPAILLNMALFGAVAWRILLPWKAIILGIAVFDVMPVLALALFACSVIVRMRSGKCGRSIIEVIDRIVARCCSIAILIIFAVRASKTEIPLNVRLALGWYNVREKAVVALQSEWDVLFFERGWTIFLISVIAILLFSAKRFQIWKTVLYFALIVYMVYPFRFCTYATLSEERLFVREGYFDLVGTEIDYAKDVSSYKVYLSQNEQFKHPGFGFVFQLTDGSYMQLEWYDYRDFPLFISRPAQFYWGKDQNSEIERIFQINFGYDYATDAWADVYENCYVFTEKLVDKLSSLGIEGKLYKEDDTVVQNMSAAELELYKKLSEKLGLIE